MQEHRRRCTARDLLKNENPAQSLTVSAKHGRIEEGK
jgi:hypothetical protein